MTDTAEDFSEYVIARYRALMRTAFLLTGDYHAAEDLVQSVLTKTYLGWHRIRDKHAVDAYVRKAIINEHGSLWRRAWRRREVSYGALPERSVVEVDERDRELWDLIRRLPDKQRAVLALRYYEDLSESETAHALGCSVSAVKGRAQRAIAALRSALAEPVSATNPREE